MKIHRKNITHLTGSSHTMTDRTPYLYLIGWRHLDVWYIGRQTGVNCHPTNLWKSYFTSSKYVKKFREEYGEPDVIECRWVFDDITECCRAEDRLLMRLNVGFDNKKFLNKRPGQMWHNHGANFNRVPGEAAAKTYPDGVSIGRVSVEDPRWATGEIVGLSNGIKTGRNEIKNKNISKALTGKKKSPEHIQNLSNSRKGTVLAFDKETGNVVHVCSEEFKQNKKRYEGATKGKIPVFDANGDGFLVEATDPRWVSGEVKHISCGKVAAKITETGERIGSVSLQDPRWATGEIVHVLHGVESPMKGKSTGRRGIPSKKCSAKITETGEAIGMVANDDPRWGTGEITSSNSIRVRVGEKTYGSLKKAAEFLNVDPQTLKNFIKRGPTPKTPAILFGISASFLE